MLFYEELPNKLKGYADDTTNILTVLIDFENKASNVLIDFLMATFRQIVTN